MNSFLTPEEFSIKNIFDGGKYSIPVYQRPYSWSEIEVKLLLEDIFSIFENRENISNEEKLLFAGTLFIKTGENIKNSYTKYDIVDGQQRITTFTLILMVLLNYFYKNNPNDDIVREIENYLWKKTERKREKELRILTLGNTDKQILINLFDELFSKKDIIEFTDRELKKDSIDDVSKNLLKNLIFINNFLKEKFISMEDYFYFFDYIKDNIRFISIKVNTNLMRLFSIFESINAKGKKLEEIDLIKNYIFQNINEDDYEEYLEKWGKLISETNDNLMDYIIVYIRANVAYYKNNIKLDNFRKIVEGNLLSYYKTNCKRDTLINFIDSLLENVIYYKMLKNVKLIEEFKSKKLLAYFKMNENLKYVHTKALYFKILLLIKNNCLSIEIAENIAEVAFKFILTYQSIGFKESKRTLNVFVDIQNEVYKLNSNLEDKEELKFFEKLKNIFGKEIMNHSINNNTLRSNIKTAATYKYSDVTRILLAYLECYNGSNIDYEKLYWILEIGKGIQIDHILPLNPDKNDNNFYYYSDKDKVILKEGQDFDENRNSLLKEDFYEKYLHIIGNLRLSWAKENREKSNNVFELIGFNEKKINTNSQVSTRTTKMINTILETKILLSADDNIYIRDIQFEEQIIQDYNKTFEYKEYEPVSFEISDEKYQLNKYGYASLLKKICDVIFELEPERLFQIAKDNFKLPNAKKISVSLKKENINIQKAIYELDEKIFIDTNFSSNDTIKFIFELVKGIGLQNSNIKILLRKK